MKMLKMFDVSELSIIRQKLIEILTTHLSESITFYIEVTSQSAKQRGNLTNATARDESPFEKKMCIWDFYGTRIKRTADF